MSASDSSSDAGTSSSDRALSFFRDRFELSDSSLATALDTALERRVDYADLYFEYTTTDSVSLEEGLVKSGDRHLEQGVGVRAVRGERQGYAHSDEISLESARLAAGTARAIANETSPQGPVTIAASSGGRDLYPVTVAPTDVPVATKVDWLNEIDAYARARDPKVSQVMASIVCQHKHTLVAASDGSRTADALPLVRINVQILAADGNRREIGYQGAGGRFELEQLRDPARWQGLVDEAVRMALLNLDAEACPAGAMDVVLGPGWPGILLHEAIGHGLEGDFNRKKTSAFCDKLGERVAAEGVTVVDDGTIAGRRGSINIDDEGTPTRRNVLIKNGVLVGYMQDRLNAKLMGVEPTGNGRRESYAHMPLPRMTNTFMLAGKEDPEEILKSVDNGLYAVSFGGGQVDITSGKFVFSASEAYRIENGQIGAPVKGATLIGNGPDVLMRVSRIGHDLALDEGVGTCGKDGQGVPVGVGLPTIRVDDLTVGGTEG
ncbi:MAG: metalloprotease TldD [Deltaproteobacteria bacterium]|nr:metalloprotease TldD [Deltaproteobacteria bacterium]